MKQTRSYRAVSVCVIVAVILLQILPLSFAQTTQNSPRRNKNSVTSKESTSSPEANKPSGDTQNKASDNAGEKTANSEDRQRQATGNNDSQTNQSPNSFDDPRLNQQKEKREPLPFDRPPLGSDGTSNSAKDTTPKFDRSANTSTTSTPTGTTSRRTSRDETPSIGKEGVRPQITNRTETQPSSSGQSPRYPADQPSYDRNGGYSTDRTQPPVLRRGSDQPSNEDSSNTNSTRGAPPILPRPTDSRETPQDRPATPGWNQPSGQNAPQNGTSQQKPGGEDEPIRLDSTLVNIPLLVSDRSNRYIPQLTAKDFLLYEDGIQQDIAFFGNEEVPFSVVLMLDMSPSVEDNTRGIQDAAIDFVRQLRPQDRVMVVSFDRHIDYLTDFTSDRYQLERAIRNTSTGSGTSVYDAVYEVVTRKLRNVDGRKALILFSDGEDTTSRRVGYDDVIGAITESDVLVYGLRYPGGNGGNIRVNPWPRSVPRMPIPLPFPFPFPFPRRGGHLLPDMGGSPPAGQWPRGGRNGDFMADVANAGGGAVYDATHVGDMRDLAYKIAEELRHVYMLSYYPSNPLSNGGFRAIRIRVKGRDDIAVRHRKGYNAHDVARGSKI